MATKKTTTTKNASKKKVTKDEIRKKAQEIYDVRIKKGIAGDADSDWRQAEKDLGVKK